MADSGIAKVTISLRKGLLEVADQIARERATTRSGVVAELLEKEERARIEALMAEGYRESAAENRRIAAEHWPGASLLLLETTEWDESGSGESR